MQKALRASSLVPLGFVVTGTENGGGKTAIIVRSTARTSPMPLLRDRQSTKSIVTAIGRSPICRW